MTTVRAILFGDLVPAQAGATAQRLEEAAERLAGVGAVPNRREATPVAMARAVMTKVAQVLDFEVADVLVGAWRTRSAVLKAAKESVRHPGLPRPVTVSSFAFPWEHEVDLDVTLNKVRLARIAFSTSLAVEVSALALVLHNGNITAVNGGELTVTAALRITSRTAVPLGMPLAQAERTLPAAYELRLPGGGLPLVGRPAAVAGGR